MNCIIVTTITLTYSAISLTSQVLRAISEIRARGARVDGVLLALHGSMVTEQYSDAEGELLRRIRVALGETHPDHQGDHSGGKPPLRLETWRTPVIVTLDLHANVSGTMLEHASCLIS